MTKIFINERNKKGYIHPEVYGHFSEHLGRCIYEGLYVGEDSEIPNVNGMRKDVVEALKEMQIPVLRWPGGCFADEYHWKDGIGPKEKRNGKFLWLLKNSCSSIQLEKLWELNQINLILCYLMLLDIQHNNL